MKNKFMTIFTAVLLLAGVAGMANAAPVKWETNGHFYQLFEDSMHWTDANAAALDLKGYLVTITSAEENEFVRRLFTNGDTKNNSPWLGGTDQDAEGTWKWGNNEDVFWTGGRTGANVNGAYTNWNPSEPNNSGNENYLHMYSNGKWNDLSDTNTTHGGSRSYIVEYDSAPVPVPAAVWLLGSGLVGLLGVRRRTQK